MGQKQSKRLSDASTTPLTLNTNIDPPGDDITGPASPPLIYRLSELIDPVDLVREESRAYSEPPLRFPPTTYLPGRPMVQSPSGHMLNAEAFAGHVNRPMSMRERQEEIRRRTMAGIERAETPGVDRTFAGRRDFQDGSTAQSPRVGQAKKGKRRGCCSCGKPETS